MGIYATGQAYEQLILHLLGHPLPEARHYGGLILDAIKAVMPSFVARVERPERGGEWVRYLERRREAGERWAAPLGLDRDADPTRGRPAPAARDGDETGLLARAAVSWTAGTPEDDTLAAVGRLSDEERERMLADLVGERENRRLAPGRGFEALRYRCESCPDYGAVVDLQRRPDADRAVAGAHPDLGADGCPRWSRPLRGDSYRARSSARRAELRAGLASLGGLTRRPRRTRSASATDRVLLDLNAARRCT
jgi:hypothetical protein